MHLIQLHFKIMYRLVTTGQVCFDGSPAQGSKNKSKPV